MNGTDLQAVKVQGTLANEAIQQLVQTKLEDWHQRIVKARNLNGFWLNNDFNSCNRKYVYFSSVEDFERLLSEVDITKYEAECEPKEYEAEETFYDFDELHNVSGRLEMSIEYNHDGPYAIAHVYSKAIENDEQIALRIACHISKDVCMKASELGLTSQN